MGKMFNNIKHRLSDDNFSDGKEEKDELVSEENFSDEKEEKETDEIEGDEAEDEPRTEEIESDGLEEDESVAEENEDDGLEEDESVAGENEDDGLEENEPEADKVEADEIEDNESEESEQEDEQSKEDEAEGDEEVSLTDEDTEKAARRIYRRKRRIRNQVIAYGITSIFLAVLIVIGVFAVRGISNHIIDKRQAEEAAQLEQQLEELEQQEQLEEPVELVIETPNTDIIEEPTLEEQLDEIVNKCISEMPMNDRVASLFIITPEALTGVGTVTKAEDATREALSKYAVGGLVYFDKNIKNREQLTEMLSKTALCSKYPIFLAVDEEGGSVSRVANSNIDVVKVDEMSVIGTSQDAVAAYEAGAAIGTYLEEIGFNLDFAPVADVVTDTENSVLGSRSFGTDATVAANMVSNVVKGMQEAGVNACLKHFPGLGAAEEDTHDGRVEITKTLEEMENTDFIPFKAGIEAGADIVMVSHVTASSVDEEGLPSSLSKVVITDVLRGKLGFEGVVITDALNMSAISEYYTSDEAAVMAIEAGADMLLMPEDFETAYNGLLLAVQEGRISEERINESLRRIFRIKYVDKLEQNKP